MKKPSISKLQLKILLTTLVATVIPIAVLGELAIFELNVYHNNDLQSIEQTLLDEKISEIDDNIQNVLDTFQLQVTYDQVSDISLSDQHLLLTQLMTQFPNLQEASFISVLQPRPGKETSRIEREDLNNFIADDLLSNEGLIEKYKVAAAGKNYISQVHYTINGPMVTIAAPVNNTPKDGSLPQVVSVITGELKLANLQKIVALSRLGNSGYVYLQDNSGFLVYSSQNQSVTGEMTPKLASTQLNFYANAKNDQVVGLSAKSKLLNTNLVAEWPISDADAVVYTVRNQIILATIFVGLLGFLISYFLASRIVRPIKELESKAKYVSQGKFDKYVNIKTGDELEQLGTAFNKMMDGLKRLEELKEEFVFVASHELRTPVTAMKGYLSMVLGEETGPIPEEAKKALTEVMNSNNRLSQLVEDLLAVARSEAGRLTIQVAPVDPAKIISEVLMELKPLADEKKIQFVFEKPNLPEVMSDQARLKEVLVNLIGNAVKYTSGSGKVAVTATRKNGFLIVHVEDQGIGMTAEEQKKLFEKFYRIKNDDTKKIQGTGLGLFIVKQIVEKMGGKIWVASKKGKGSTFSFSLVLAKKN
jgi:signal transduction histidine kinase